MERYNRAVRHEWLDQYIIETIEEARDHATPRNGSGLTTMTARNMGFRVT